MKLYLSHTSPFARKVNMFLHCTNLIEQCELIETNFESEALRALNPLGKIPSLTDGELTLFDSTIICSYLDDRHIENGGESLIRRSDDDYFLRQKLYAFADGILDAAVASVMELRRDTEHSTYWLARWRTAIEQSLTSLPIHHAGDSDNVHLGTLTLAAALGYLDFRLPLLQWRSYNPALTEWFEQVQHCAWFTLTAPPEIP